MRVGYKITQYFQLRKAYREMARLDDAALKDIGVNRSEIKRAVWGR